MTALATQACTHALDRLQRLHRHPPWRGYSSQRTLHRGIVNHRLGETRELMREALQVTTWIRRFIRWRLKFRRRFLGDRAADRILSFWGKIFGQRFVDWIKDIESSGEARL